MFGYVLHDVFAIVLQLSDWSALRINGPSNAVKRSAVCSTSFTNRKLGLQQHVSRYRWRLRRTKSLRLFCRSGFDHRATRSGFVLQSGGSLLAKEVPFRPTSPRATSVA